MWDVSQHAVVFRPLEEGWANSLMMDLLVRAGHEVTWVEGQDKSIFRPESHKPPSSWSSESRQRATEAGLARNIVKGLVEDEISEEVAALARDLMLSRELEDTCTWMGPSCAVIGGRLPAIDAGGPSSGWPSTPRPPSTHLLLLLHLGITLLLSSSM